MGLHRIHGSQFSSKAVAKTDPDEKVGVFCQTGEHLRIIEYSKWVTKNEIDAMTMENSPSAPAMSPCTSSIWILFSVTRRETPLHCQCPFIWRKNRSNTGSIMNGVNQKLRFRAL